MKKTRCPKCRKIVYKDSYGFYYDSIGISTLGFPMYQSHKCKLKGDLKK